MSQRKVMVIGMDSATLDLVRPWAAEGRLPNLSRFLNEGASGVLLSTIPVISSAAWSTFATGVNPGKHGVIDFCQLFPDNYQARFVSSTTRRVPTFWDVAGRQDVRGGVMNVPVTYPPQPYNGFVISGVLSPGVTERMANPPEVFHDLLEASPHYRVDVDVTNTGVRDVKAAFLDETIETIKARTDAAVGLYRKHRPPLFVVAYIATDRICHYFWNYHERMMAGEKLEGVKKRFGEAIRTVYELVDEGIGRLMAEADDDTDFVILSDHGAGARKKGLDLRKVLAREGLLTAARSGPLGWLTRKSIHAFANLAPTGLKSRIKDRFAGLTTKAASVVACAGIDFARTKAYPSGDSAGVWVNLKGRQPKGVVEPGAEYKQVRQQIVQILTDLADPETGERVAKKAHLREEVWSGSRLEDLPDVIMEQEALLYETRLVSKIHGDDPFYSLPDPELNKLYHIGGHRREGMVMALGPHIRHANVDGEIPDVPATVLALLGCKIPDNFDGRVLAEMLTDDVEAPQRIAAAGVTGGDGDLSEEEQKAVEQRLKGLGYL